MELTAKARLIDAHRTHWSSTWTWLAFLTVFFALQLLLLGTLLSGQSLWIALILVLLLGHLMHAHLVAFHETAHRTLCPSRFWNDAIGLFIGTLSFMAFTLYRVVHHSHHAYLATRRDEELWPFVDPDAPRWSRRLAAALELSLGLVYTPLLFLRSFLRTDSPVRRPTIRRLVWFEFAVIAAFWGAVIAAVAWWSLWRLFIVLYVCPAWIAGNLQSLRKYIEHLGTSDSSVLGATRSVVSQSWIGRVVALSLFNVSFHGVHHKFAGMPQSNMPRYAAEMTPRKAGELAPYCSYRSAMWDMIRTLGDPRVGAQWHTADGLGR